MARGAAPQPAARRTVLVALAANASIAVAKLVAGLVSGSSAILAECAHSVADTMNQVFLLYSLAIGEREPDAEHPFGYGKERFFWSFLAAVGIFVAGAGFSLYEGLQRIFGPETESGPYGIAYAVLAFAVLAEGASLMRAYRQTRDEAAESRQSHARYVRASRDPTTKTVLFEDSAAVIGVVVAFAGVALHQATGNQVYDGLASVVIAVLLATVAVALGRDTKALLIGEAASPEERQAITEIIEAHPAVDRAARAAHDGARARPAARRRAHRPGRRSQRRRDRARVERPRPRAARTHCDGVAGVPRCDSAQRGATGFG